MLQYIYLHVHVSQLQAEANKPPEDMPDVVNDFDIEDEEIAVENR